MPSGPFRGAACAQDAWTVVADRLTIPMKRRMRTYVIAILGMVIIFPFSAPQAAAGNADDTLFMRLAERSWVLAEPVRVLTAANLYEEIDGEAELYLPYDFLDLKVAYLFRKERADVQLRLELFRHGSPRDAFGIYSQHRFPGQETTPIGPSEAIVSDASLDFFRGDRFVRIRAASPAAARPDLMELGRAVSAILEGTGSIPPEAGALLISGFVPGTLVYQKRAILGYNAFAPGYEAKFSRKEAAGTVILVPTGAGGLPKPSAEAIAGGFPGFGKVAAGLYRIEIAGGTLWLKDSGAHLIGVAGKVSRDLAEPIISEIGDKLKSCR